MSKNIVAGRSALKRYFKDFIIRSIDDGKDTRSFIPFRKQREAPVAPPWLFIFHGDEGLGKTTAVHYCSALAEEVASEFKKTITTVSVDWDDWTLNKGKTPATPVELMDAIADLFSETDSQLSGHFASYKKLSASWKTNENTISGRVKVQQLNRTLSSSPTLSEEVSLDGILEPKELELHEKGEQKLCQLIVSGVLSSAEEIPCIFSIDGYHCLSPELDEWFRTEFLTKIAEQRTRLFFVISGGSVILRPFRNSFSDDAIYAVNFADISLTRHSISRLASRMRIKITEEDVALIERVTAGVPLLVHDILFYAAQGIELTDLFEDTVNDVHAAEGLSGSVLDRFFTQCAENTTRERIFSLSMLSQYNPKALAEIWNIPFADVKHALSDIENQVSFIKNRQIHHHIRKLLRISLIQEAGHGGQSDLKPFFVNFSSSNQRIFKELLIQLQTAVSSALKRCHDPRYIAGIEQLICGLMWTSPTDAFIALPGYYIELLHFNPAAARELLTKIAEFRSLFSPINEKIFKQLVSGLHFADKSHTLSETPVKEIETDLLTYLDSVAESMSDFQRALLYHMQSDIELRKGDFSSAMEHLDRSFSLLGNSAPEKSILYENYVLLGHNFSKAGEHRNAIDTFSNAVLIQADGFIPWFNMGTSRMALGEYEAGANALAEAVKIDPYNTDAWYKLGMSLVKVGQHAEAVDAFIKGTEIAPERPEIWFDLGQTYVVLSRHTDAVKAFRKVVLAQPENADAWLLLGRSCSSLGTSNDAIEAFQKAIEISPRLLGALKALGKEYFGLDRFDEAIQTFNKATRISKKDPELWWYIAEANLGAREYEKAVTAGNKALAIKEDDPRALSVIGNAYLAQEKYDEAIEAFKKAVDIESDNADIWQKLGTIYINANEYEPAIEAFKKAVAFNPDLKEVWYTIGRAYEAQDHHADAVAAYEKGIQVDPGNIECWYHKGTMHQTLEQQDDAFDSFSHVVELDPSLLDGWFDRGTAAFKSGNFKDAVQSFAKVVEIDPENAEGWFQLGCSYQKQEDHQEAIRSFTEAANHDRRRSDIWMQLGLSCEVLGIYEEAVQAFEKCAELDKKNPFHPTHLGMCHYALGKYDEAYSAYSKAVKLDSGNLDTLYQLAITCHAQENYDEAIQHYLTITKKNKDHDEAWFNLALAYHATEKFEKAIKTYLAYIKRWPDNGSAWFNLGLAYHADQDIDNAIQTYKEATKVTPDQPDIWYHLALAFHTKELYGDAIQSYRKVLQFMPDHLDTWFNLGMAYYVWQNYVDAIESYSNVVKRSPEHVTAWTNLAIACFANEDYQKGFDAARRALELNSEDAWILGSCIVGALFTGDSLQAQQFADQFLTLQPSDETLSQVIALLKTGLKKNPETDGGSVLLDKLLKDSSPSSRNTPVSDKSDTGEPVTEEDDRKAEIDTDTRHGDEEEEADEEEEEISQT